MQDKNAELVPREETVLGTESQVRGVLESYWKAGRLVTPPERLERPRPIGGGRVAVKAVFLLPRPAPAKPAFLKRHPVAGPVLQALGFIGGLVVLSLVLLAAVGLLIAGLLGTAGLAAVGGLVLVALLLVVGWRRSSGTQVVTETTVITKTTVK